MTEQSKCRPVCVIMAGGAGTRFWPLSTDSKPKQFLNLVGDRTFLQYSYDRARTLCAAEEILVFTHADYRSFVVEQLPEIPLVNIFCEPERRDTAAAIAWSSLVCHQRFGPCCIITLTSDHWIEPLEEFALALREFYQGAACCDGLYTMGIQPTWPSTGYGYLELGPPFEKSGELNHFQLLRFREKPNRETAEEFIESGRYLWNSGMFAWRSDVILRQFEQHLPRHIELLRPVCDSQGPEFQKAFSQLQKISIDFAILEKAPDVRTLKPRFQWSDLGGWQALGDFMPAQESNRHRGELYSLDSRNNLVFCQDPNEQVALIGVYGLTVVRLGRKTLVVPSARAEDIKALLQRFPELNRDGSS